MVALQWRLQLSKPFLFEACLSSRLDEEAFWNGFELLFGLFGLDFVWAFGRQRFDEAVGHFAQFDEFVVNFYGFVYEIGLLLFEVDEFVSFGRVRGVRIIFAGECLVIAERGI